jgi:micrococcal nuclease
MHRVVHIVAAAALTVTVSACTGSLPASDSASSPASPAATATSSTASGLAPRGPVVAGTIVRVVDGDTVRFLADGQREDISVRLIGINTPETVAPGRPVECFGPEASRFAEEQLTGARVLLELDPSQGETDRFDRTLGYIWTVTDDGQPRELFNLIAVRAGFAEERQYGKPFAWQPEFVEAEQRAQEEGAGMWGAC